MFRKKESIIKVFLLLVAVLAVSMLSGCTNNGEPSAAEENGDYVAIVNGEGITAQEYQDQLDMLKETIMIQYDVNPEDDPQLLANIENQAMQSLVHEILVVQEANNRGIEVAESEVEEAIERIKVGFESEEAFLKALEDNNLSVEKLKEQIRKDLLINQVLEQAYIEAGIVTETGVMDEEEKDLVASEFLADLVEKADIEYNNE